MRRHEGGLQSKRRPTVLTDVRTIVPRVDGARRDDILTGLDTESVRVTQVCGLAADPRSRTLRIVGEYLTGPAIAVDLARIVVILCQNESEERPEKNNVDVEQQHLCSSRFRDVDGRGKLSCGSEMQSCPPSVQNEQRIELNGSKTSESLTTPGTYLSCETLIGVTVRRTRQALLL